MRVYKHWLTRTRAAQPGSNNLEIPGGVARTLAAKGISSTQQNSFCISNSKSSPLENERVAVYLT